MEMKFKFKNRMYTIRIKFELNTVADLACLEHFHISNSYVFNQGGLNGSEGGGRNVVSLLF